MSAGKRNANRTRDRILRAAIAEFATHGYSGARVERIRLYVVMVALCYFHRSNTHTLSFLFDTDLLAAPWQDDHQTIAIDLLTNYLRPRAPGPLTAGEERPGRRPSCARS